MARVGFLWVSTNHDVKTVGVKGSGKWVGSSKGQEVVCAFPRAEKWLLTQLLISKFIRTRPSCPSTGAAQECRRSHSGVSHRAWRFDEKCLLLMPTSYFNCLFSLMVLPFNPRSKSVYQKNQGQHPVVLIPQKRPGGACGLSETG